jgi:hypothetical protein
MSRLIPWIQCGIHEKTDGFLQMFQKELTLYVIGFSEKEEGKPYSKVSVQKIWETDRKGVDS